MQPLNDIFQQLSINTLKIMRSASDSHQLTSKQTQIFQQNGRMKQMKWLPRTKEFITSYFYSKRVLKFLMLFKTLHFLSTIIFLMWEEKFWLALKMYVQFLCEKHNREQQ